MNMYKMLIVDDEIIVRRGIKSTINWADFAIEIVGEASNGLEGYQLAKNLNPDIIISDVKMPLLSGIELARQLKDDQNWDGIMVILSGYREFDYAKAAMESNVFSYLLKPVSNDELVEAILEALKALDERRKNRKIINLFQDATLEMRSKIIRDIIRLENLQLESLQEVLTLNNLPLITSGHVIVGILDDYQEEKGAIIRQFMKMVELSFSNHGIPIIIGIYHNRIVGYIATPIEMIFKLFEDVFSEFEKMSSETFSFGVSDEFVDLTSLRTQYEVAKGLATNCLLTTINSIVDSSNASPTYKTNLLLALEYIHHHFADNLTVDVVANSLLVSSSYLMHLFKNELNKTFNEVLTDYRMRMAKKYLQTGIYRINEVSSMVGYKDEKYFTLIFKKSVGQTPSEYKKNLQDS